METYTKWIMGHRRNLATVTIPAIIFRYVYRGGRGGGEAVKRANYDYGPRSKGSSRLNLRV